MGKKTWADMDEVLRQTQRERHEHDQAPQGERPGDVWRTWAFERFCERQGVPVDSNIAEFWKDAFWAGVQVGIDHELSRTRDADG